jgi:hypothetical protein
MSQPGNKCVESSVALGYGEITDGNNAAANVGFDFRLSLAGTKPPEADVLVKKHSSYLN